MTTQDKLADALREITAFAQVMKPAPFGTIANAIAALAEHDAQPAPVQVGGAVELPPLPEAAYRLGGTTDEDGFDADDMYEYARAAIAALTIQICANMLYAKESRNAD